MVTNIKQGPTKTSTKGVQKKMPPSTNVPSVAVPLEDPASWQQQQYPPYVPNQWDPYYPQYPPQDQGYPPQDPNYTPQELNHPPQELNYPVHNPNYPPQDPNYPPQGPNYPPQDPNYPPQNQQYLPNHLDYPPQDPNLVKEECPPEFYPPGEPSQEVPYPYPPSAYPYYAPYPPQDYYPPGPYGFHPPPPPDHPWDGPVQNYHGEVPPMPKVEPDNNEPGQSMNVISNSAPLENNGTVKSNEMSDNQVGNLVTSINNSLEYPKVVSNRKELKFIKVSKPTESNSEKKELGEWMFDDPDLPTGWIIRTYKTSAHGKPITEHEFLSPEQILFDSLSSLIKFMKSEGTFSQEFMENLIVNKSGNVEIEQMLMNSLSEAPSNDTFEKQQLINQLLMKGGNSNKILPPSNPGRSKSHLNKHNDWTSDDDTLPKGWKKRSYIAQGRERYEYLSTTGETFAARSAVVEHMKMFGMYTAEEIKSVLSGSKSRAGSSYYTDWADDDETLPAGWKRRSYGVKSNQTKTGKLTKFQYLNTENETFTARSGVVDFMKKSGTYSSEEIDRVLSGRKTGNGRGVQEATKDSVNHSKQIEAINQLLEQSNGKKIPEEEPPVIDNNKFTDWSIDATLPEGWKIRSKEDEKDHTVVFQYLSPDSKLFKSKSEVDKYVKTLDSYKTDIQNVLTDINKKDTGIKESSPLSMNEQINKVGNITYNFECNYCPQKFISENDKLNHQQQNHAGEFRYKCSECGVGDLRKTSLFYHVQSKHKDVQTANQVKFEIEVPDKKLKTDVKKPTSRFNKKINRLIEPKTKKSVVNSAKKLAQNVPIETSMSPIETSKATTNNEKIESSVKGESQMETNDESSQRLDMAMPDKNTNETDIKKGTLEIGPNYPISDAPNPKPSKQIEAMKEQLEQSSSDIMKITPSGINEHSNETEKVQTPNLHHDKPSNDTLEKQKLITQLLMKAQSNGNENMSNNEIFSPKISENTSEYHNEADKIQYDFECNYCPKQFLSENEKLSHQQQYHAGEFRFKCSECGTGNLKKMSLFYHVQSKHLDGADKVKFDIEIPDKNTNADKDWSKNDKTNEGKKEHKEETLKVLSDKETKMRKQEFEGENETPGKRPSDADIDTEIPSKQIKLIDEVQNKSNQNKTPPKKPLTTVTKDEVMSPKVSTRSRQRTVPDADWEIDPSLPKEWKKRSILRKWNAKGVPMSAMQYHYMSPTGHKFISRAQVIAHMKQTGNYTEQEVKAVENGKKGRGYVNIRNSPKSPEKNKTEPEDRRSTIYIQPKEVNIPASKVDLKDWVTDDEMLPKGWVKRSYVNLDNVKVFQYCNDAERLGKVFTSTKEVFYFMKYSRNYSLDDALKFLSGVEKQENGDTSTLSLRQDTQFEFECNYCPLQFVGESEKLGHQQRNHAGEFRFKCSECGIGNLKKMSLFYHVNSKHSNIKQADQIKFDIEVPSKKLSTTNFRKFSPPSHRFKQDTERVVPTSENLIQNIPTEMSLTIENDKTITEPNDDLGLTNSTIEEDSDSELETDEDNEVALEEHFNDKNSKLVEESGNKQKLEDLDLEEESNKYEKLGEGFEDKDLELGEENDDLDKMGEDLVIEDLELKEESNKLDEESDNLDKMEDVENKDLELEEESDNLHKMGEVIENEDLEFGEESDAKISVITEDINDQDLELGEEGDNLENMEEDFRDQDLNLDEESKNLSSEGWVTDPTLPEGCKRRSLAENSIQIEGNQNMGVTKFQYLSPDKLIFDSRREIMDYMDIYAPMSRSEIDSDSEIDDMDEKESQTGQEKEKLGVNSPESKVANMEEQDDDVGNIEDETEEDMEGLDGLVSEEIDNEEDGQKIEDKGTRDINVNINMKKGSPIKFESHLKSQDTDLPGVYAEESKVGDMEDDEPDTNDSDNFEDEDDEDMEGLEGMISDKYNYEKEDQQKELNNVNMENQDIDLEPVKFEDETDDDMEGLEGLISDEDNYKGDDLLIHSPDEERNEGKDIHTNNDMRKDNINKVEVNLNAAAAQKAVNDAVGTSDMIQETAGVHSTTEVGPKVTIKVKNFEMVSSCFIKTPNPGRSVMQDIAESNNMSVKDVKWTFIKLRHKFQYKKGEEINREAVEEMVYHVKEKYKSHDLFVI